MDKLREMFPLAWLYSEYGSHKFSFTLRAQVLNYKRKQFRNEKWNELAEQDDG